MRKNIPIKLNCQIDYYLSRLQVYGYLVTINNHNIGSLHNVEIRRLKPLHKKWWWFGCDRDINIIESVTRGVYNLPDESEELINLFKRTLSKAKRHG